MKTIHLDKIRRAERIEAILDIVAFAFCFAFCLWGLPIVAIAFGY